MTVLFTSSEKVGASPGSRGAETPQEIPSTLGKSTEGQARAGGEGGAILSESQGLKSGVMESSLPHAFIFEHFLCARVCSIPAVWAWATRFASEPVPCAA